MNNIVDAIYNTQYARRQKKNEVKKVKDASLLDNNACVSNQAIYYHQILSTVVFGLYD